MPDTKIDIDEAKEEVIAYIEDEVNGATVEQVIQDLEIPGHLLPDILHELVESGQLRVVDHRYYLA